MRLVCLHVSRPKWWRMLMVAYPMHTPATQEKLKMEQIISKVENVMAKQLEYLWTQKDLTILCDGGTTKGREAFWMIHISTPKWKVYLMECCEATSESHTGVWIKNLVLEVCSYINHCFLSAAAADIFEIDSWCHWLNKNKCNCLQQYWQHMCQSTTFRWWGTPSLEFSRYCSSHQ